MSILNKIRYYLKGQNRSHDLSGVDIFVGPNGSGKTTALLAITAGLRGLAESPADPIKPYIGPTREGTVELTFDTGTVIRDLSETRTKAAIKAGMEAERIAGEHLVRWDLADFSTATESSREALLRRVLGSRSASDLVLPETPLRAELLKEVPLQGDAGAWLDEAIGWARKEYTTANAANKVAIQGAESAQQSLLDAPAGMLSTAKQQAEGLERQIAALKGEAASAKREAEAAQKAEAARQRAANRYGAFEAQIADIDSFLTSPLPTLPDMATLQKTHAAAREATAAAQLAAKAPKEAAVRAKAVVDAERATLAALESLAAKAPTCAHCKGQDPLGLLPQIAATREALDNAGWDLEDAEADLAIAERKALREVEALMVAATAVTEGEIEARRAVGLLDERGRKEKRKEEIQAELEQLAADMRAEVVAPAGFGSAELLASLEEELKAVRKTIDLHTRHAERGRLCQESIAKRETAKVRFDNVKALGEALKVLQASEAERAFAPLTTATNELLVQMQSPFRLQVNSAADFGATDARRNGAYTPFWSLSDAERACVGAAMALALVRLSRSPWPALILDGLEKMDATTLEGFLEGVRSAFAAGWLANFVGALVSDAADYAGIPGIDLHWMGAK